MKIVAVAVSAEAREGHSLLNREISLKRNHKNQLHQVCQEYSIKKPKPERSTRRYSIIANLHHTCTCKANYKEATPKQTKMFSGYYTTARGTV